MLRLTSIIVNSLYSPSDIKYIYISTLKFSNLSISESSSFNLISDTFKGIDMKIFPKLKGNNIYFIIVTLYSMFTVLTFF